MNLDQVDLRILEILSNDGKASFTDMAETLNLSIGTIRNRYNKLVNEGVLSIVGWVDPHSVDLHSYARINIHISEPRYINSVIEEISNIDQVTFIARTTGEYEIEINVICRNNDELIHIIDQKIAKIEGVHNTNTTIYLKVKKWSSFNLKLSKDNEQVVQ